MIRPLLTSLVLLGTLAVPAVAQELRLDPADIGRMTTGDAGPGTSGLAGITTTILSGDPSKPGLYTIRLSVPPNTTIAAHSHSDDRSAIVLSGTWYFGYGDENMEAALKPLPPGSFYTEPPGKAHFARTGAEPVVVYITGTGPTDTIYVDPADTPRP
jgi:quercetin dioxygenase-like cupin family protein